MDKQIINKTSIMKNIVFLLILAIPFLAIAQPDFLKTTRGEIKLTPVLHASMVMEWNDLTIYIDPYGGPDLYADFPDADLVLITHAHGDHLNKETLKGLNLENAELIAPQSVIDDLGPIPLKRINRLDNGRSTERLGISVEAIPMYNLPDDETSRHKPGWGNGYILTIDGTRIYISGDTEDIPEMRELKDIDYAFVCMNLPYTMTVEQAADAVLEFKPGVVYPYHFRGQDGFSDVQKFKSLVSADEGIEVRLRDWYPGD